MPEHAQSQAIVTCSKEQMAGIYISGQEFSTIISKALFRSF